MNVAQVLRDERREFLRRIELAYARIAPIRPAYPDFMCIGAPRAATTWLFESLRADPRIFLPKLKELHFFDEDERSQLDEESGGLHLGRRFYFDVSNPVHLRWYWLQFRRGVDERKGDITPAYSMLSADRVRVINELMPDLRVIYIIRNPIDRAWSGLRKTIWYQKGASRVVAQSTELLEKAIMHPLMLARGDYRRTLATWECFYPQKQMLLLFYDDIVDHPAAELDKVYEFLDLDRLVGVERTGANGRVNSAPERPMPESVRARLQSYYRDQILFLESRFDRDLRHWMT